MPCAELGPGWCVETRPRKPGSVGGTSYKIYISPSGKRFKSMVAAQAFLVGPLCVGCGSGEDAPGNEILLCDMPGCPAAWHLACLEDPLHSVPEGDWHCPDCEDRMDLELIRSQMSPGDMGQEHGYDDGVASGAYAGLWGCPVPALPPTSPWPAAAAGRLPTLPPPPQPPQPPLPPVSREEEASAAAAAPAAICPPAASAPPPCAPPSGAASSKSLRDSIGMSAKGSKAVPPYRPGLIVDARPACISPGCGGAASACGDSVNMLACGECGKRWQSSWWFAFLIGPKAPVEGGAGAGGGLKGNGEVEEAVEAVEAEEEEAEAKAAPGRRQTAPKPSQAKSSQAKPRRVESSQGGERVDLT